MEPEATLESDSTAAYQSFFCRTHLVRTGSPLAMDWRLGSDTQIVLQPGEHYVFFWNGLDTETDAGSSECHLWGRWCRRWKKVQQAMNFIPGPYTFVVSGKVHEGSLELPDHTFAEAVSVKISLPQLTILLCAGVGSILGYLLVNLDGAGDIGKITISLKRREMVFAWLKVGRGLVSAFLTGSILSVVANRLSDTQFPIKVSINDVWGSITVGFVFFFIGTKVSGPAQELCDSRRHICSSSHCTSSSRSSSCCNCSRRSSWWACTWRTWVISLGSN